MRVALVVMWSCVVGGIWTGCAGGSERTETGIGASADEADRARWDKAAADLVRWGLAEREGPATEAEIAEFEDYAEARLFKIEFFEDLFQSRVHVDGDGDGVGEFGTLSELLGRVPLRRPSRGVGAGQRQGSAFRAHGGRRIEKIFFGFGDIDPESGVLVQRGYVFELFLPDSGRPSKWVFETWDSKTEQAHISGSGAVDVDLAEEFWCAYAIPLEWGKTGRRVFFRAANGTILQSENKAQRWEGVGRIDPTIAFLGTNVTSAMAVGTRGGDGEIWTPVE